MDLGKISEQLMRVIVGNPGAYAEQQPDGSYRTVYNALKGSRIRRMLKYCDSYMTYQIYRQHARWICLDFDIKKSMIDSGAFQQNKAQLLSILIAEVRKVTELLETRGVKYLAEFSGNRGIHIWVCCADWFTRNQAYDLASTILDQADVDRASKQVGIDIFPPTRGSKSKLGKGVKLPLSKHKKSRKYSYIIEDMHLFEYGEECWVSELTQDFLNIQVSLLEKYELQDPVKVLELIGVYELDEGTTVDEFMKTQKMILADPSAGLDTILNNLKTCAVLAPIVDRYRNSENLTEKERAIFVGLLNRIVSISGDTIGRSLLLEFFSRMPNYKPQLTAKKLDNLHLYPPSCRYLKDIFRSKNCPCEMTEELVQKSPIELIDGLDIVEEDIFSLSETDIRRIKSAQVRYTQHNDEVALFPVVTELEQYGGDDEIQFYTECLKHPPKLKQRYIFRRQEKEDSFRDLVSLTASDKVLTTWFTRILHSIHGFETADDSYGYRFEPSFANGNIFKPWIGQWKQYTRYLKSFIENEAHNAHTVIKLDIKSFYSTINLERLNVKLFDGPSTAGKAALDELDRETKGKYQTICAALINYCIELSDTGQGVPQGPAFARYLAEIYLLELDELIRRLIDFEDAHYYRYVDDIFIFIDDHEYGVKIDEEVRAFLATHDLNINEDKAFLGSVESYRPYFSQYNDENKYFIDQVSWGIRTASDESAKTAVRTMCRLLEGDDPGQINPRNISFFLTHLRDNPLIQQRKEELVDYLFSFNIGRGSLYRNFQNFYLPILAQKNYQPDDGLLALSGLHRTVFLNSFLRHLATQDIPKYAKPNVRAIIKHFSSQELTEIEIKLVLSIMLIDTEYVCEKYIHDVISDMLFECVTYRFNKRITLKIAMLVRDRLLKVPFPDFVRILFGFVFTNQLPAEIHPKLAELFFNRALEQIGSEDPETHTLVLFQTTNPGTISLILNYYDLCCLYSLSMPAKSLDSFKRIWANLVSCANRYPDSISRATSWLLKTSEITVSGTNFSVLLTAILEDGFLTGRIDEQRVYENYHEQLLLFVVASEAEGSTPVITLDNDGRERLLQYVKDKKLVFLEWILSDRAHTELYPNKNMCLRNAIDNDLIILRRGNQLLVRAPHEYMPAVQFDFLGNLISTDEITTKHGRKSHVYEFDAYQFEDLHQLICGNSNTLVESMNCLLQIVNWTDQFRETYLRDTTDGYPNFFVPGLSYNKSTRTPLVPFTAFGQRLLIQDSNGTLHGFENSRNTFLGALLDILHDSDTSLMPFDHPVNVCSKDLGHAFYPEQQRSVESRVEYLSKFISNYNSAYASSPFDMEFFKCLAIWHVNISDLGSYAPVYPSIGVFLSEYHSMYMRGDSHRKLIFACSDCIDDHTLDDVYGVILSSLAKFLTSLDVATEGLPILDALWTEISLIRQTIQLFKRDVVSFSETMSSLLENVPIAIYQEGNPLGLGDGLKAKIDYDGETQVLQLNGQVIYGPQGRPPGAPTTYIFQCGKRKHILGELSLLHYEPLSRGYTYVVQEGDTRLVIVLSSIIQSSFDTINRRSRDYSNILSSTDGSLQENIACYYNSYGRVKNIRASAHFAEATSILQQHHFKNDQFTNRSDIELHLVNWLAQFTEDESEVLLTIIAAHHVISKEDVNTFIETVIELRDQSFIFSTKSSKDMNGLHRMFITHTEGQTIFRELGLDTVSSRLARTEVTPATQLVILSDISISGAQLGKALREFYFADSYNEDLAISKRYHQLCDDFNACQKKLLSFRQVHFVLSLYTDKSRSVLTDIITEALGIMENCIHFHGREVKLKECMIKENPNIRNDHKEGFIHLVENVDRLQEIFLLSDEQRMYYEKSVQYVREANLVLRVNTIPKRTLNIFSLKPKNPFVRPLFNRISEHPPMLKQKTHSSFHSRK